MYIYMYIYCSLFQKTYFPLTFIISNFIILSPFPVTINLSIYQYAKHCKKKKNNKSYTL